MKINPHNVKVIDSEELEYLHVNVDNQLSFKLQKPKMNYQLENLISKVFIAGMKQAKQELKDWMNE